MPTPMNQRRYRRMMDEKDGIPRIEGGKVLVETVGPWQTWIGEPGADVHSTKFHPPTRLLVPEDMAESLVRGNAVKIIEKPKPKAKSKRKKPAKKRTKAMEPEENK